jgi:hypothetical protein
MLVDPPFTCGRRFRDRCDMRTIDLGNGRSIPATRPALERLYLEEQPLPGPSGVLAGELLCWLEGLPARHPLWRPLTALMFQLVPFGVDFDRRCWYFGRPGLQVGRFELVPGRSRLRATTALGLHYQVSSLPGPVKGLLYDEVKPLDQRTCLGLGGLVLGGQAHPLFFFLLRR